MQKPNKYDETQAKGEFIPIELGGHKMVIKQVAERKDKNKHDQLVILFDFADGDTQPNYFMTQFKNDIRPDKRWPNAGTNYMGVDENTEYGTRNLKTFITCVEKSNPGFTVRWGDNFGEQFKGKLIGGVFRIEQGWYNGKQTNQRKLAWFRSAEGVKEAQIPDPIQTKELQDHLKYEADLQNGTDFMNIPDGVEDEIPFN